MHQRGNSQPTRSPRSARRLAALVALIALAGCAAGTIGDAPAASYGATDVTTLTVRAASLDGREMPALVFRPRGVDAATLPILYVFHGYGGNAATWFDGHGGDGIHLDAVAQQLIDTDAICPVVIVSAFIGNSYGVDSGPAADQFDHGRYERYLLEDLMPTVETAIDGPGTKPPGRFVGGLSMGGFAALHLGLRHRDLFEGIGALSPAAFVSTPKDRQWLFDGDPDANDPMLLVRTADVGGLRLFLGVGTNDYGWVRDGARELSRRLATRGMDVPVTTVGGGHDGGTWRQLVRPMLEALLAPPCAGR